MRFSAKKSLGQHFLLNPSTVEKILNLAKIHPTDHVLEIGPGPGVMTELLVGRAARVVAVEKDSRFAAQLEKKFDSLEKAQIIQVIEADFLDLNLEKTLGGASPKWKVIANLPYNVATEILFHLLEMASFFQSFHLMFQKEVAERIVAKPGSKTYGILSVFAQLFSENRIVMRLKPGAFTPPPKVDSAVVEFQIAAGCRFDIHHLSTFESVVRSAFGQRRKTIANALKAGLNNSAEEIAKALSRSGIPPTARAETVSIDRFAAFANNLYTPGGF